MTPVQHLPAFEAVLVHLGMACASASREELVREGYVPAGGDARYGSEWWLRPAPMEREA